ncbi:HET-domain-containing protein [Diaporthe amygdali]|uniref:HET-domain-containing protein n=1 Tax=Phomopsis amygdali TaxID=1214568 RepID=UPI0022FEE700|nr:HET-domain-containing protein [Diaporthe amygdali]KAJ0119207.1 HET-domain-containing protein [Diaporthe amygdali]
MSSFSSRVIGICNYCQKIPFDTLRCPTYSEFEALRSHDTEAGKKWFGQAGKYRDHRQLATDLGLLSDIKLRREQCNMCKLIWKVLQRRGPYKDGGPKEDEIKCNATNTYYGVFYPPGGNRNDGNIILRLSIFTAKLHTALDWDGHHEQYCFQACTPGTTFGDPPSDPLSAPPGLEPTIFGGRKRPLTVNCDWLRTWMRICAEQHGDTCSYSLRSGQEDTSQGDLLDSRTTLIRFIDTQKGTIITLKNIVIESLEYAALSYVWGKTKTYILTAETATELEESEGIVEDKASKTIVDAIELCRTLGVRYLWVDALCILQDDPVDKAIQLQAMSHIYRCASFTIVAASGDNADAGLPGLRPGTRSFEQEEVLVAPATDSEPALSLMTTANPKLKASVIIWRKQRGIHAEQVYFSCNQVVFCEESYNEYGPPYLYPFEPSGSELSLRVARQHAEPDDASERFWIRYRAAVERFTRRELGYKGDVYDAFAGLQRALSDMSGEKFVWGLPCSRLSAALAWDTFSGQRRRGDLSTLPMTELNERVGFPSWSWMGWIGEAHVSVTDERLELGETPLIGVFCHAKNAGRVVIERIAHQQTVSNEVVVRLDDIHKAMPGLTETRLLDVPSNHVLFFWADSATFKVETEPQQKLHIPGKSCKVVDVNNNGEWEFIAISRRQLLDFEAFITVIQIDRQHDIACRLNIGEVSESAWNEAGPELAWSGQHGAILPVIVSDHMGTAAVISLPR